MVHVYGWPIQLWEALIANIDAKAILYSLSKRGTYNVRAFSSMMGETFFSEVSNQDKRGGKGTLTANEFAHFMNNSMEQMRIRLDEKRSFAYRTARSTVYNLVDNMDGPYDSAELDDSVNKQATPARDITQIQPKDHFFDSEERRRNIKKAQLGTVFLERNAVQKGTLGVRWEKSRVNECKILPTKKMGIDCTD